MCLEGIPWNDASKDCAQHARGQRTQRMAMSQDEQLHRPQQHRPHPVSQCLHIRHQLPQVPGLEKTIGTNLLPPSHLSPSKDQGFPNPSLPPKYPDRNTPLDITRL
ncbi:unnamed protein product [Coregonus sp. 'balchen']|nr:unnamed protein product [Coregonus sp. 'balchen']